jgi:cellulase/cellobiase CelA1
VYSDTIANVARLEPAIADVPCDHILGVVVYDLPGRDCAAKASNGELKVGELTRYKSQFIDREFSFPVLKTFSFPSISFPPAFIAIVRLTQLTHLPPSSHRQDPQGKPQYRLRPCHRARLAA